MIEYRRSKNINFKYAKGSSGILGRMFHDYYEVFFLLNGEAEFINDHIRQRIRPFQLVAIPAGEYHQFIVYDNADQYERCVLEIYPDFSPKEVLTDVASQNRLITLNNNDRITEHFLYLNDRLKDVSRRDYLCILDAVATDILFLIKRSEDTYETLDANINRISLEVMEYINKHFSDPPELAFLAQKFYCSVSSMCHIFKKDYGISIKKYINQKRINAAAMDIRQGQKPETVSIKYGFSNYSSFYRAYKNQFGVSPSCAFKTGNQS